MSDDYDDDFAGRDEDPNPFSNDRRPYDVGYGKPPREHRFKKGNQAACGKRRGKKRKRVEELLRQIAEERCEVLLRGKRVSMTRVEALVRQEFERAMNSSRAAGKLIDQLREIEGLPMSLFEEHKIVVEFVGTRPEGLPCAPEAGQAVWRHGGELLD